MLTSIRHLRALLLAVVIAMLITPTLAIAAQDASPETDASLLEALGLPVLEITVSADGTDFPTETVAGPQLLVVHNETEGFVTSALSILPEGVTDEDYLAAIGGDVLPEWVLDAVIAGGFDQDPGTTSTAVVDLAPDSWTLGLDSEDVTIAQPTGLIEAAGEVAEDAADAIPADLNVSLGAYVFDIPDTVPAGPQIWRLTNTHTILHHIIVFQSDKLYTPEEVQAGVEALFMGTPVADGFSLETAPYVFGTSAISGGASIWVEADLEPGYYVALCFLPDPGSDTPHLFMGMIDTFEVVAS